MAKKQKVQPVSHLSGWWTVVAVICYFLLVCFNLYDAAKGLAITAAVFTLLAGAFRFRVLRENLTLPLLFAAVIALFGGISVFYAVWGNYATYSATHLLVAICGVFLLVSLFGTEENAAARIAGVLACCTAILSLLSIDYISTHILSTPVLKLLTALKAVDTTGIGVEPGVRITSIFNNPNVFAGSVGIGVLLSLGLAVTAQNRKSRTLHLCCLYLNALAFVLTFSMGAMAAIVVAFVLYLVLECKERRGDLLVLMVEALVLVLLAVVPISATSLKLWTSFQPVPILCAAAGCALLCTVDAFVGCKIAAKLQKHGKLLLVCLAVLFVLVVVFASAALLWTTPANIKAGEGLRRAAYPEAGEYTVSSVGAENVYVTVESQDYQQTMMHTSTVLYQGALSDAAFSVPAETKVVYLNFSASSDAFLEKVELCSDAEAIAIPLEYALLPDFISNRLQGLRANQNAIQRTVFFRDGLKLFRQSPIIGLGLGAFEMAYSSVQEFYYETKYVHNHYIETLLETGVIGFFLFVGLLAVSAVMLLKARRKEGGCHPLIPALGALVVYMAIHAAVEVVFSSGYYLPIAFGVFAIIGICCRPAVNVKWLTDKVRSGILLVLAAYVLTFGVLLVQNLQAKKLLAAEPTFASLETAMKKDKLEWKIHANSYIVSVTSADFPEEYHIRAEEIANKLETTDSRWINYRLAHYYLSRGQVEKAMEKAEKHIRYNASNSEKWNELFTLLAAYEKPTDEFVSGVRRIVEFMNSWDAENMGSIQLSSTSQAFVERILN